MEKVLIFGGARGLGEAFHQIWLQHKKSDEVVITSRQSSSFIKSHRCDVTRTEDMQNILAFMSQWQPQRVFYFPGGGPYGPYAEKQWKDHIWSLKVNLLAPMEILHHFMQIEGSRQMVIIGSAIAESAPDPFAASYSAGKHGLKGVIGSLQTEGNTKDIRLFSPGYMATGMLPKKAIDDKNLKTSPVEEVAQALFTWAQEPKAHWHWLAEH